jgi:tetratricopeptide (TPR) repeat protein
LPLALRAIARWLPQLTTRDLVSELERSLDLLDTADPRNEGERDVCALLAEMWEGLSREEQRLARGLSVFQGGFDRAAAREVAGCSVQQITRLVDAGLIKQGRDGAYRMQELGRRYAVQQLAADANEAAATRVRYVQHYGTLVRELTDGSRPRREAADTLIRERRNIRDAWSSAIEQEDWETLVRISDAFSACSLTPEEVHEDASAIAGAIEALQAVAIAGDRADADVNSLLVLLSCQAAWLLLKLSRYEEAEQVLAEASTHAGNIESRDLQARLAYLRGTARLYRGRYASSRQFLERAVCLARDEGMPVLEMDSLLVLGQLLHILGDTEQALDSMQQVASGCRTLDHFPGEAAALTHLGRMATELGENERARMWLDQARRILDEGRRELEVEGVLHAAYGLLSLATGRFADADESFHRALAISQQAGRREGAAVSPILGECGALTYLGRSARTQGNAGPAQTYLSQALSVSQETGSSIAEGVVLVEMSTLARGEGHLHESCRLARQALTIMDEGEPVPWRRSALITLGHAHFGLGNLSEAHSVFSQTLELDRQRGHRRQIVESTAALARVCLAEGDRLRASALLQSVVDDILSGDTVALDEPVHTYLAAYEILSSIGDKRQTLLLESRGRVSQPAGLPDEMSRLRSLQKIGVDRDVHPHETGNGFHAEDTPIVSASRNA